MDIFPTKKNRDFLNDVQVDPTIENTVGIEEASYGKGNGKFVLNHHTHSTLQEAAKLQPVLNHHTHSTLQEAAKLQPFLKLTNTNPFAV